ncbi:centriole and centriolar satellite protein OFD1-like, partial [Narcine bancroftii]|uniref:centriole and centriolar satellite protein OFD1-like n=1 Tax=Narcine bancroftii TaxID=1343680 RepID=UPI003831AA8B
VERCAQVRSQLLEFEDQTRRLNGKVDDLKLQLRQTQIALENEVYRNPKPSQIDRSTIDFITDRILPPDICLDPGLPRRRAIFEERFFYPSSSTNVNYSKYIGTPSSSSDSDQDFVAGAKARIRELEKESENLEEAYRNYQNRVIQSAVQKSSETCAFSPLPINSILSKISSIQQPRVTFADYLLTSEQSKISAGHQVSEESHQPINIVEDYQTPSVHVLASPKYSSSMPVKQKHDYDTCMKTSEGEGGSFLITVPSISEHHPPTTTTSEVQSCVFQVANTANCPSSNICGADGRSENNQIDNPVPMSSTIPFEQLLDQPDDHCGIMQESVSMLNKNLSQCSEENENKGSVLSLDQEIISSPADACKLKWIDE